MVQVGNKIIKRIANWTIISDPFLKGKTYFVTCKCICGTVREVRLWYLKKYKTLSCGCINTVGRFKYNGCGDLSLSYFNAFKKNRKHKNKNFIFDADLTIEYMWNLFLKQNKKCALSGLELYMDSRWSSKRGGSYTQTASIDRIDNSKGYSVGNVQWVHKDINLMKGSLNEEDFIKYCIAVSKNKL